MGDVVWYRLRADYRRACEVLRNLSLSDTVKPRPWLTAAQLRLHAAAWVLVDKVDVAAAIAEYFESLDDGGDGHG